MATDIYLGEVITRKNLDVIVKDYIKDEGIESVPFGIKSGYIEIQKVCSVVKEKGFNVIGDLDINNKIVRSILDRILTLQEQSSGRFKEVILTNGKYKNDPSYKEFDPRKTKFNIPLSMNMVIRISCMFSYVKCSLITKKTFDFIKYDNEEDETVGNYNIDEVVDDCLNDLYFITSTDHFNFENFKKFYDAKAIIMSRELVKAKGVKFDGIIIKNIISSIKDSMNRYKNIYTFVYDRHNGILYDSSRTSKVTCPIDYNVAIMYILNCGYRPCLVTVIGHSEFANKRYIQSSKYEDLVTGPNYMRNEICKHLVKYFDSNEIDWKAPSGVRLSISQAIEGYNPENNNILDSTVVYDKDGDVKDKKNTIESKPVSDKIKIIEEDKKEEKKMKETKKEDKQETTIVNASKFINDKFRIDMIMYIDTLSQMINLSTCTMIAQYGFGAPAKAEYCIDEMIDNFYRKHGYESPISGLEQEDADYVINNLDILTSECIMSIITTVRNVSLMNGYKYKLLKGLSENNTLLSGKTDCKKVSIELLNDIFEITLY